MFETIKKILGLSPAVNYKLLFLKGAMIIDVRTAQEYKSGHIKGSINIPLNLLTQKFGQIQKEIPLIVCCASGMRSASAKSILRSNGFSDVHNGGGWMSLNSKLK